MKKLEQDARQALNWIDANAPRYVFEATEEALAEQVHTPYCKQAPMCKTPCGNSDCVEQAEQEHSADTGNMVYSNPSVFDGVCCGCSKKAADGWALYCVS